PESSTLTIFSCMVSTGVMPIMPKSAGGSGCGLNAFAILPLTKTTSKAAAAMVSARFMTSLPFLEWTNGRGPQLLLELKFLLAQVVGKYIPVSFVPGEMYSRLHKRNIASPLTDLRKRVLQRSSLRRG